MNAKMPELKRAFETAGFTEVSTLLSSGNLLFSARSSSPSALEKRAEKGMTAALGHSFLTFVRPVEALRALLDADPYAAFRVPSSAKRVVTFLRSEPAKLLKLPLEVDGARILCIRGAEIFTAYTPSPRGAAFMVLIEKTFGKEATTRTWETVTKVARRDER